MPGTKPCFQETIRMDQGQPLPQGVMVGQYALCSIIICAQDWMNQPLMLSRMIKIESQSPISYIALYGHLVLEFHKGL